MDSITTIVNDKAGLPRLVVTRSLERLRHHPPLTCPPSDRSFESFRARHTGRNWALLERNALVIILCIALRPNFRHSRSSPGDRLSQPVVRPRSKNPPDLPALKQLRKRHPYSSLFELPSARSVNSHSSSRKLPGASGQIADLFRLLP
jgi:hypothetical protein